MAKESLSFLWLSKCALGNVKVASLKKLYHYHLEVRIRFRVSSGWDNIQCGSFEAIFVEYMDAI